MVAMSPERLKRLQTRVQTIARRIKRMSVYRKREPEWSPYYNLAIEDLKSEHAELVREKSALEATIDRGPDYHYLEC